MDRHQVLLYKFFEDSLADLGQWRVVLNLLGREAASGSVHAPRFDETRHAGICSEVRLTEKDAYSHSNRIMTVEISLCCDHESAEEPVDR